MGHPIMFHSLAIYPSLFGWLCLCMAAQANAPTQTTVPPAVVEKSNPSGTATPRLDATPDPGHEYSKEGIIFEKIATSYDYSGDGTGTRTIEVAARVQSEAAVHQFGVLAFNYASGNEQVSVDYLRVRKADGSVTETPASDAQDLPTEVTRQAPLYSDLREFQIPVKSLAVGDRLEYRLRFNLKDPLAPGQFWGSDNWLTTNVALDEEVELSFPANKYVQVLSPADKPVIAEQNGRKVYRWHSSQLEPTGGDKKTPPDPDAFPSMAWTTFRNWEEIGNWYRSLGQDRAAVTPTIDAAAKKSIEGKTTDDEKIEAIYNYVSLQVRYIGVDFGIGRYQPHAAADVLANRYGDCKDKATLLTAMLKAAGYDSWPALIGAGHKLHADYPSPAQFNHVITVVPRGDQTIWLDSTPEVAPWKMLVFPLRDKQALVMPTTGAAKLMRTPVDGPFPFLTSYTATAQMDTDGTLKGHIAFTMRGDDEVAFRAAYRATPRAQWRQLSQNLSQAMGYAGTVSDVDVTPPDQTAEPFRMAWNYDRKEYADWGNHRILPLMTGVELTAPGDSAQHVQLAAKQVEDFHSEIELPPGYTADVPDAVKLDSPFGKYQTTYKLEGHKLITDRRFELLAQEVSKEKWSEYKTFTDKVNDDIGTFIPLSENRTITPIKPETESAPGTSSAAESSSPAGSDSAQALINAAEGEFQYGDYRAARRLLEQAQHVNPKQRGLWATFAQADVAEAHYDAVVTDIRKELENDPENQGGLHRFVENLMAMRQTDDAIAVLKEILKAAPDDARSAIEAGDLLIENQRYDEATALLEVAHKANGKDLNLAVDTARANLLANKRSDAVGMLRETYKGADNAEVLAGAAQALVDKQVEMGLAEDIARRALDLTETRSARIKLASIDNDDMETMQLLARTWDALGWIYFEEAKLDLALSYARPAFFTAQNTTAGYHLGRIYEKQGKVLEALGTYSSALNSIPFSPDSAAREGCAERRRVLITKPPPANATFFTALPSIRLPLLGDGDGGAEFLVTIDQGHIVETRFIRGDQQMKAADEMLRKADYSAYVPSGSAAHLVRHGLLSCTQSTKHCMFTMTPAAARVPW